MTNNNSTFTCTSCRAVESITELCNMVGYPDTCKECYHDIILEETYNS